MLQPNSAYGKQQYLPYSVGMLISYVQQYPDLYKKLEFRPLLYKRDKVESIVGQIGEVDVLCLSSYIWNFRLNMAIACEVRKRQPGCLIVVGGPHVPDQIEGFFEQNPFLDAACHREGEKTFCHVLKAITKDQPLNNIDGLSYYDRATGEIFKNPMRTRIEHLDEIPSPYLTGVFDHLFRPDNDVEWQVMWETNRGCPFTCTFCDWGSAIASKVRKFGMDRLLGEIQWFADHRVSWVFGCDANFGILPRDKELAAALAEAKERTGYPHQFRVCFTKNSNNRVFGVAKILHDAHMSKGVSLSMQSLDSETLANVRRDNIKLEVFHELQARYLEEGVATFSELIIGLPGETYESFRNGLDVLLDQGQHSGINIYNCSVMPNAEMGDPEYQKKYKLRMVDQPIFQAHAARLADDVMVEYEPIVIETHSMTVADWRRIYHFAWAVQCFHLLGSLQAVSVLLRNRYGVRYSTFYEAVIEFGQRNPGSVLNSEMGILDGVLDNILSGTGSDQYLTEFLDITWPPEEASHLRFAKDIDGFYRECRHFLDEFLLAQKVDMPEALKDDLMRYQQATLVHYDRRNDVTLNLRYNLDEYIKGCRKGNSVAFEKGDFKYKVTATHKLEGDAEKFAREVVWYGRKGGKFIYPVERVHADDFASIGRGV